MYNAQVFVAQSARTGEIIAVFDGNTNRYVAEQRLLNLIGRKSSPHYGHETKLSLRRVRV